MLTDEPNLFPSHKDIKVLFKTISEELKKANKWRMLNKLCLKTEETFHKNTYGEDLPLLLSKLSHGQ